MRINNRCQGYSRGTTQIHFPGSEIREDNFLNGIPEGSLRGEAKTDS